MDKKSQEEPLFQRGASQDDSFYDTIDRTAEYDNEINTSTGAVPTREEEQLQAELVKLEEEINTLRAVLCNKQREAAEIKRKLGITPLTEMRHDLKTGITNIKESDTVKKTNEALTKLEESITQSDAYQKTNLAFKSFGAWSSKKIGDMRNSNTFKSFEERVGGAYTSVKNTVSAPGSQEDTDEGRVTTSQSEQNFEEALRAAQAENGGATSPATDNRPDEKVPL